MFKKILKYKKDILAVIFLCFLSFVFLNNLFLKSQIFTSQDLGQGDITHYNYPILNSYAEGLKTMRIPLWTDYISTGFPIFAEGQGALFLSNLIIYFLFPTYFAFNLTYLIVFITASVGMYLYCRYLSFARFPSLFASIAYAFSFIFIGHVLHITVLQAISLFPWLMLAVDNYFSKGSRLYLLIFTIVFSQQYLTGFIQCMIYSIIAIYVMMFFRYFKKPHFAKNIILLTFACLLSLGIAGAQFLPSTELYAQSTRSSSTINTSKYLYSFKDLVYFINPFFWGDPSKATYTRDPIEGLLWENNIYSGILPFAFLIIGFSYFRKKIILRPYIYLFFLSLTFSLGWFFFLQYVPPFSMFRLPQRALFLTSFAYAIIAGFAFNQIFHAIKSKISNNVYAVLIGIVIVSVSFLDVFLNGRGYNGGISKDIWLKLPETAVYLQSQKISGRIVSFGGENSWFHVYNTISHGWRGKNADKLLDTRAALSPNANMLYGISSVNGSTVYQTQNNFLTNQLMFYGDSTDEENIKLGSSSAKLLGMEGVQYIVSTKNVVSDSYDFDLVWKKLDKNIESTYKIYKNKQFVDIIHPVRKVIGELSAQQMINDLVNPDFTPKDTALIYDFNSFQEFPDEVKITDIENNNGNITFQTSSSGNSFIVIANSYYPGWKALIDGQENNIINVNINSQGLSVPKGKHDIKLLYSPTSYSVGKIISMMSLLFVIVILFWPIFKKISYLKKIET
jgi:hypothetical protein